MLIPYLDKSLLVNFIKPNMPSNFSTYVEPFGGMFCVFFSLSFDKYQNTKFIYNDNNNLNYLLFNNLSNPNFIELVKSTEVDRNIYKKCVKKIISEKDEIKIALYWLIILTCSSPYEIGKDSWSGNSEFNIFKLKYKAYKYHIDKISKIHNLDYKCVIDLYDSESTFFYVDPPYFGNEKYYINNGFTEKTHYELSNILNNIKGKFLLSYYYFPEVNNLYRNCRFDSKETILGTQLSITNY